MFKLNLIIRKPTKPNGRSFCKSRLFENVAMKDKQQKPLTDLHCCTLEETNETKRLNRMYNPWLNRAGATVIIETTGETEYELSVLNFLDNYIVWLCRKTVLVLRKYILRYLEAKCHDVCNSQMVQKKDTYKWESVTKCGKVLMGKSRWKACVVQCIIILVILWNFSL